MPSSLACFGRDLHRLAKCYGDRPRNDRVMPCGPIILLVVEIVLIKKMTRRSSSYFRLILQEFDVLEKYNLFFFSRTFGAAQLSKACCLVACKFL